MTAVVDCSVFMAWLLAEDEGERAFEIVTKLADAGDLFVPAVWPFEVANVLLTGERRGRVAAADVEDHLADLASFGIRIDPADTDRLFRSVLPLGRTHKLSSYDAAYLELAIRLGTPLATFDEKLSAAAKAAGVPVMEA